MALIVSGDRDVLGLRLTLPVVGVWTADVLFDGPDPQTGRIAIDIDDGVLVFSGTVTREGEFDDTDRTRVVAGAGGMGKVASPKQYTSPSVQIVLADLLATAGETLAATADPAILGLVLPAWTTEAGPIGVVVTALLTAAAPAASWRMLPDGTLWVGTETWPDSGLVAGDDYQIIDQRAEDGSWVVALDVPPVLPGLTFEGNRVSDVVYDLEGHFGPHVQLWFSDQGEPVLGDRISEALERVVRGAKPAAVDFRACYWAKVVQQAGGTIEVDPEVAGLPDMGNIPLYSAAGDSVDGVVGGNVLIGWRGGDRSKPYATSFDGGATPGSRTLAVLTALNLGGPGAQPTFVGAAFLAALAPVLAALAAYIPVAQPLADPVGTVSAALISAITAYAPAAEASLTLKAKVL